MVGLRRTPDSVVGCLLQCDLMRPPLLLRVCHKVPCTPRGAVCIYFCAYGRAPATRLIAQHIASTSSPIKCSVPITSSVTYSCQLPLCVLWDTGCCCFPCTGVSHDSRSNADQTQRPSSPSGRHLRLPLLATLAACSWCTGGKLTCQCPYLKRVCTRMAPASDRAGTVKVVVLPFMQWWYNPR